MIVGAPHHWIPNLRICATRKMRGFLKKNKCAEGASEAWVVAWFVTSYVYSRMHVKSSVKRAISNT
jgi:hypothetical protein